MLSRNVAGLVARSQSILVSSAARRAVVRRTLGTRNLANTVEEPPVSANQGWLFVDSVFPIRLGIWDIRHYIGVFREESLLGELESRLSVIKTHGFRVLSLEPYQKDGGVFIKFAYCSTDRESALKDIEDELRAEADKHGMPSWAGLDWGNVWLVKGRPWLEDMSRYPSPLLKVAFEGPDVQEEALYELFRPYGRISDLTPPKPAPAGTLRSADVSFVRVRSAVIARNAMHGYRFPNNNQPTRFQILYERPIRVHAIRNWLTTHPKIVLPILFFLLGTLTYTIFDPIRALSIEGKMLNWFDYREYGFFKWLRTYALDRLSISFTPKDTPVTDLSGWKERREAENALRSYLSDPPLTAAFVHGPQGSGKTHLVSAVLQDSHRKALVIDCAELNKATSDSRLVAALAQQTGYRPVFTFLNSLTNIVDVASVAVIGQKAGLSNSLPDKLKQILEVVSSALINVNRSLRKATRQEIKTHREAEARRIEEAHRRERIRQGTWHDGRLDCVSGNGIMSELGIGDEAFSTDSDSVGLDSEDGTFMMEELKREKEVEDELTRQERTAEEVEAIAMLPVVVIKNYEARGSVYREEVQNVLSQWVATLIENKIAHVIVVSDSREQAKLVTRALPSKPLNFIPLYDADTGSAMAFVKQRLRDAGMTAELTKREVASIECFGGRASDLEILIHKVRSGQAIEDAVEDIISRSIGELRKSAFGEDIEDAKSLPWAREQVWTILKQLAQKAELPYYDVLANFPFKGDELALLSMDHSELISIGTLNGRPSTIRPGKPVFKYVFERLVNDPVFRATQDMAVNDKLIAGAESTIKACEAELATLQGIAGPERYFQSLWRSRRASVERGRYLMKKMYEAQMRIQALERQNTDLKKTLTLAKGT
ncbi:RNA12 protein-domain-containing protein [Boletus edulis BED1]|uniref:Mitochondrial escape protein 2 n=1 Tax=Boletus edulis BED1 TaxID=1328754 RepID=A0AAD4BIC2_BOLED|nr:RNA12 protein-domain-containing protein [Boletus edulis BED1]